MNGHTSPPRVLTIAGSDSGGGAGVQADLKAFAACGAHGMTAITAITAQNTVEVRAVHHVPPEVILAQIAAVAEDIGIDAVKIGMLGRVETIQAVAAGLDRLGSGVPIVVDPVMVAESGAALLEPTARTALIEEILPRAAVVTPNLPEARTIVESSGCRAGVGNGSEVPVTPEALARAIHALGPSVVVITGGHRDEAIDLLFDGVSVAELAGPCHTDGASHGSGCTHSSVLAARLAWGDDPVTAARAARELAARAVAQGLRGIGAGAGPVDVLAVSDRLP